MGKLQEIIRRYKKISHEDFNSLQKALFELGLGLDLEHSHYKEGSRSVAIFLPDRFSLAAEPDIVAKINVIDQNIDLDMIGIEGIIYDNNQNSNSRLMKFMSGLMADYQKATEEYDNPLKDILTPHLFCPGIRYIDMDTSTAKKGLEGLDQFINFSAAYITLSMERAMSQLKKKYRHDDEVVGPIFKAINHHVGVYKGLIDKETKNILDSSNEDRMRKWMAEEIIRPRVNAWIPNIRDNHCSLIIANKGYRWMFYDHAKDRMSLIYLTL